MSTKNPIEESLGIDSAENELDDWEDQIAQIEIPDDPELQHIVKFALEAYKDQMINMQNYEPKYRARAFEVAQQYLNLAKDAIAKKEDIRLKDAKLDIDRNKKTDSDTPGDKQEGLSREDVLRLVKGVE